MKSNSEQAPAIPSQEAPKQSIETMTELELKALCYDQILLLNQAQQNINIIQAELAKRNQER